jgi:hypothetical protein
MMSRGLNPAAPPLVELADMGDAELFWVTKYGIRFTGMPAWASSHNDQDVWSVVAFLRASRDMQAMDYDALDRRVSQKPAWVEVSSRASCREALCNDAPLCSFREHIRKDFPIFAVMPTLGSR